MDLHPVSSLLTRIGRELRSNWQRRGFTCKMSRKRGFIGTPTRTYPPGLWPSSNGCSHVRAATATARNCRLESLPSTLQLLIIRIKPSPRIYQVFRSYKEGILTDRANHCFRPDPFENAITVLSIPQKTSGASSWINGFTDNYPLWDGVSQLRSDGEIRHWASNDSSTCNFDGTVPS